jgi:hypothetical protein
VPSAQFVEVIYDSTRASAPVSLSEQRAYPRRVLLVAGGRLPVVSGIALGQRQATFTHL